MMANPIRNAVIGKRWAFDTAAWSPTETQWLLAASCLQQEEKERISRFVFQRDAKLSIIGRLMMRKFVADNSDIPYDKVRFDRDDWGKPYLDGDADLSFNVSHQGHYTVLAGELSRCMLGVDVMKIEYSGGKSLPEFFRVMTRNFSQTEWDFINAPNNDHAKLTNFCRHWCLKESYVKATGTGISVDLGKISFLPLTKTLEGGVVASDTTVAVAGVPQQGWVFHESLLDDDHCVAVAMHTDADRSFSGTEKPFTILSFDDLMHGCKPLYESDDSDCSDFFNKSPTPRSS